MVLPDAPTSRSSVLIAAEWWRSGTSIEVVPSVECAVSKEAIGAAVQTIGAASCYSVDYTSRRFAILGGIVAGNDRKLGYSVYAKVGANH